MSDENPYASPEANASGEPLIDTESGEYGGIRRLPYFGGYSVITVVYVSASFFGESTEPGQFGFVHVIGALAQLWLAYFRRRNMAVSKWLLVGLLIPLVDAAVTAFLMAAPEGYGEHKQVDLVGRVVFVISFILLGLASWSGLQEI